jgi:hypothetical protein
VCEAVEVLLWEEEMSEKAEGEQQGDAPAIACPSLILLLDLPSALPVSGVLRWRRWSWSETKQARGEDEDGDGRCA